MGILTLLKTAKAKWDGTRLIAALAKDNEAKALRLIKGGADIRQTVVMTKDTTLHLAAAAGMKRVVNALIEAGVVINAVNNDGHTPMQVALQKRQPACAERIRQKGGQLGRIGYDRYEFLLRCAPKGMFVRYLKPEDITKPDAFGNTLLHKAADAGRKDIVAYLLRHGADAEARNKGGYRALELAATDAAAQLLMKHMGRRMRAVSETAVVKDQYFEPELCLRKVYDFAARKVDDVMLRQGQKTLIQSASFDETPRAAVLQAYKRLAGKNGAAPAPFAA